MSTHAHSHKPAATRCSSGRICSLALLLALGTVHASAANGSLAGRVSDTTSHLALCGAKVTVTGTNLSTYTDPAGGYFIGDVPAGSYTLEFSYVGFPELTRVISVEDNKTTRVDGSFGGEIVAMEKLNITGSLIGTVRAINQQKSAATLTNVVASDDIGRFPDQNAAESLQRIPGVALYRDQGEGRFIIIRGVNAGYNHVSMNGAPVATPEAGSRNAPLDVVGSSSLGSIEVTKVNTPDMDADGLGGHANLRTRSAFDSDERQLSFDVGGLNSGLTHSTGFKFNGLYSEQFLDGNLGVLISPSFQHRPYGSHNFEEGSGWSSLTSPGDGAQHYFFNEIAYRDYQVNRNRDSLSTAIDYRLDDMSTLSVKAMYSLFNDKENRWVTDIPFSTGKVTALDDSSATITGIKGVSKRLRTREKDQKLGSGSVDYVRKGENWDIDLTGFTSEGRESKPNELEAKFDSTATSDWTYAFPETYRITSTAIGGADMNNPASFTKAGGSLKQARGTETESGARFNVRYNFDAADYPCYVKTGAQQSSKFKGLEKGSSKITAGPADYTFSALAENAGNYPYFTGPRISSPALRKLFFENQSAFTLAYDPSSVLSNFNASEDITATYGMTGITLGKLELSTGIRLENTDFSTTGYKALTTKVAGVSTTTYSQVTSDNSYNNWLPGVYARYNAGKNLILRASLSSTLSRPEFSQTAIALNEDDSKNIVSQGNPNLKPLRSTNWDASAEYYLPSLGVVSAAVFVKDIRDFTYQQQALLPATDPTYPGYQLTSYYNGNKGRISGLELGYQQQLVFLPAPLNGLGVSTNMTFSDSEADYWRSAKGVFEKAPFIGQSRTIGNVALTYEKGGFSTRLAGNFRSKRLREDTAIGTNATDDRYVDNFFQLDLSTSLQLSHNWELYGEWINLTNEPFRVYFGNSNPKRLVQFEEYNWSANFGVRWKL